MKKQTLLLVALAIAGGTFFSSCKKDKTNIKIDGEMKVEKVFNASVVMTPDDRINGLAYHNGYLYTNSFSDGSGGYRLVKINTSDYTFEIKDLPNPNSPNSVSHFTANSNNFDFYEDSLWIFSLAYINTSKSVLNLTITEPETFEGTIETLDTLNISEQINGVTINSNNSKVYTYTDSYVFEYTPGYSVTKIKEDNTGYHVMPFTFGKTDRLFEWNNRLEEGAITALVEYDYYEYDEIKRVFEIPNGRDYSPYSIVYAGEDVFFVSAYNYTNEKFELLKLTLPE